MNTIFLRRTFFVPCLLAVAAVTTAANSATQAKLVSDFGGGRIRAMVPLNGGLWLAVLKGSPQEGEIWFSDGTPAGTIFVKSIPNAGTAWPRWLGISTWSVGDNVCFSVEQELAWDMPPSAMWRSDGTEQGTVAITQGDFPPQAMGIMDNALYFIDGPDIWRTDGTEAGTFMLRSNVAVNSLLEPLNGVGYFRGRDTLVDAGAELWRTNGTVAGTYMAKDIYPGEGDGFVGSLFTVDDKMLFIGQDGVHGNELWTSDGTADGTYMVKDLYPGPDAGVIGQFFLLGEVVYFTGQDADGGGLFQHDGTLGGTYRVKTIRPGAPCNLAMPTIIGDRAIFFADDGVHGREPWVTNGTAEGTSLVMDIYPGAQASVYLPQPVVLGDYVYFFSSQPASTNLWKTDGSEQHTLRVSEENICNEPMIKVVDNQIYFGHSENYGQLFRSDGTPEGTVKLATLRYMEYVFDVWSFNGDTYFASSFDGNLGRVIGDGIEWVDMEDVELGVSDRGSGYPFELPAMLGNQMYLTGTTGGLWAINRAFRFTQTPHAPWHEVGDPLSLSVGCEGGIGELSYQWFRDGEAVDGATDPTYHVDSVTHDHEGSYTCRVTDETDTVYETDPLFVDIFPEGAMPAAGPLALFALAAACTIGAARVIKRRKN